MSRAPRGEKNRSIDEHFDAYFATKPTREKAN